jgi:type IV secretory pathway VirD2 relaxase
MARIDRDDDYSLRLRLPKRKPTPPVHVRPPRFRSWKRLPGHALSRARGAGATSWMHTPQLQRSTVKASYATSGKTPWKAHGSYLAREGAQREGEKGRGFTAERDDVDLEQTLSQWQKAGDRHHFRFIVSPEQVARMDLRQHARDLVQQMEKDLGTRLEWVAIDHYNTAHPHVHVLVRGRDATGNTLVIARAYIREGIRTRSQELVTNHLGYRLEHDILAARA